MAPPTNSEACVGYNTNETNTYYTQTNAKPHSITDMASRAALDIPCSHIYPVTGLRYDPASTPILKLCPNPHPPIPPAGPLCTPPNINTARPTVPPAGPAEGRGTPGSGGPRRNSGGQDPPNTRGRILIRNTQRTFLKTKKKKKKKKKQMRRLKREGGLEKTHTGETAMHRCVRRRCG
jgi:hypothetical protein